MARKDIHEANVLFKFWFIFLVSFMEIKIYYLTHYKQEVKHSYAGFSKNQIT